MVPDADWSLGSTGRPPISAVDPQDSASDDNVVFVRGADLWAARLIQQLIYISFQLWEYRNAVKHLHERNQARERRRLLDDMVKAQFGMGTASLLPRCSHHLPRDEPS